MMEYFVKNELWYFDMNDLPISNEDRLRIKRLTEESSKTIWEKYISIHNHHPMLLDKDEWPNLPGTWYDKGVWVDAWNESDQNSFDNLIGKTLWKLDEIVYFAYGIELVLETTWSVFNRNWKNFLFDDEEPFLFSPNKKTVITFKESGIFYVGLRK
jgi:Protein of unknown function (DUF2947)